MRDQASLGLSQEEGRELPLRLPRLVSSSSRDPSIFLLPAWRSVSLGQADDH